MDYVKCYRHEVPAVCNGHGRHPIRRACYDALGDPPGYFIHAGSSIIMLPIISAATTYTGLEAYCEIDVVHSVSGQVSLI